MIKLKKTVIQTSDPLVEYCSKKVAFWSRFVMPQDMLRSFRIVTALVAIVAVAAIIRSLQPLFFGCICGIAAATLIISFSLIAAFKVIKYTQIMVECIIEQMRQIEEQKAGRPVSTQEIIEKLNNDQGDQNDENS